MRNNMRDLQLPFVLQITYDEMCKMPLSHLANYFEEAELYSVQNEFADCFWTALSHARTKTNIRTVRRMIKQLQHEKSKLAKKYNDVVCRNPRYPWLAEFYAKEHNKLEYTIRWLCYNYKIKRYSTCYLLK